MQPGEEEVQALESYEALSRLVEKAEKGVHAFPPPQGLGGARVRVEVAPDNALASAMKASEGGAGDVIVLLGAEAVLPSRAGDVVATMGSWMLAEMAKRLKVKVRPRYFPLFPFVAVLTLFSVRRSSSSALPTTSYPPPPLSHLPSPLTTQPSSTAVGSTRSPQRSKTWTRSPSRWETRSSPTYGDGLRQVRWCRERSSTDTSVRLSPPVVVSLRRSTDPFLARSAPKLRRAY